MSHFNTHVAAYVSGPVVAVQVDTPVAAVLTLFEERNISAVPVLDARGHAVGVVSRTDLLRIGTPRPRDAGSRRGRLVDLPNQNAGEVMHRGIVCLPRETPVAVAAKRMVDERMHRIFVAPDGGAVTEVFSTREVMMAIWEARVPTPIGSIMSRKPFVIPFDATVAAATARLEQAHTHGLVVTDAEGWPVGLFTQREALEARSFASDGIVEDAMSHGMLCLHRSVPLYRAAAQAAQTRSRRVLVVEAEQVVGVLTGLDFARFAHGT